MLSVAFIIILLMKLSYVPWETLVPDTLQVQVNALYCINTGVNDTARTFVVIF